MSHLDTAKRALATMKGQRTKTHDTASWVIGPRTVQLDAAQCRAMGIDQEDTTVTLPDGFDTFRLACLPDGQILGLCPEDDTARELMISAWDDPTAWASKIGG